MRILLFSTNANNYNPKTMHRISWPSCKDNFQKLCQTYLEHSFVIATQMPGTFLIDYDGEEICEKSEFVEYHLIPQNLKTAEEIARFLDSLKCDLALPVSFWDPPYDWHCVMDSIIAEKMSTYKQCIDKNFSMLCFQKQKIRVFLEQNGFSIPNGFSIDRELYMAEKSTPSVKINVYKEYIQSCLEKMEYPIVIKDTCGLSSFNVDVINTLEGSKNYLHSKKMKSNRLVEKFIKGIHAGIEIMGNDDGITVLDPFFFSVNQYGITSPKQSIKIGPVTDEIFMISKLKSEMSRLGKLMNIKGLCQVDLVFDGKQWYIIEINPRISGMTAISAASLGESPIQMIIQNALGLTQIQNPHGMIFLDMKLLPCSKQTIQKLSELDFVLFVCSTINDLAKQHRECGYTQIIIFGNDQQNLRMNLNVLKEKFPDLMEESFFQKALEMTDYFKKN